jgi:hypothetical protein
MAAVTACDFESAGPAGTVLTNANTGGTVSIGVGAAAVSTAVAAFGSLAGQFDVPATNVSSRVTSAVAGSPLQIQISYKFRIPAAFATSKRMFIVQNTALGTVCSINYNGTTDRVQLQNSAGAGTVTVTNTLPLDAWYRVELDLTIATAATGAYVLNLYANDSKVPINAVPFTGAAYDLGTVAVGALQHGINTNGTAVAATVLIDSVRYDAGGTTELGPEAIPVTAGGSVGIWGTASLVSRGQGNARCPSPGPLQGSQATAPRRNGRPSQAERPQGCPALRQAGRLHALQLPGPWSGSAGPAGAGRAQRLPAEQRSGCGARSARSSFHPRSAPTSARWAPALPWSALPAVRP